MTDLDADTLLDVRLSATISRHRFDADPGALLAELAKIAGGRGDILAQVAGMWAGYHEENRYVQVMIAALREVPGADVWVEVGRRRRAVRQMPGI